MTVNLNNNISVNNTNQQYKNTKTGESTFALKVENLSKIFVSGGGQTVALRNINFAVRTGEFISIVGPSGSGKSTLLNILGALDKPTFGKIFIGGIDVFSLKDNMIARMRN
ncbi:MAG: ATP-binding cassette domain-containing protein, partial [Candidatus Nitrosocosmicus sp.]